MMCLVFQDTSMSLIKSSEVVMGEVEERKVGDQLEFLAKLYRKDGRKVVINTPFFRLRNLDFDSFGPDIKYVKVPMTEWLRDQVREIENGVDNQIRLPDVIEHLGIIMKRMFCNGSTANIVTSKFLKLIPCDDNGNIIAQDSDDIEHILDTEFSFRIEFVHVYMGMHKNGHTVSCSTRVTAIRYKTKVNKDEDSDTQLNDDAEVEIESKLTPEKMTKLSKAKQSFKRLNGRLNVAK